MAKEAHLPFVDDDGQGRDGDAYTTIDGNIERTNAVHLRWNIIKDDSNKTPFRFASDSRNCFTTTLQMPKRRDAAVMKAKPKPCLQQFHILIQT